MTMDAADRGGVTGPGSPAQTNGGAPHVRRLRTLKRKKEEKDQSRNQVKLERVLGLTVTSNASLATAPATGQSQTTKYQVAAASRLNLGK